MRRLFAAAALAPLTFAAHGAYAQTSIETATTAPVSTSATGALTITSAGSITVAEGAAVTVDSNTTVSNAGTISVRNSTNGTGILVTNGRTGTINLSGVIAADDTFANIDADGDGDLDGRFVTSGVVRYGVRIVGPDPFTGDINQTAGQINVEGNDGSAAISIETGLNGNLITRGGIGVLGSDVFGIHVTGPINGNVRVGTADGAVISARGENAIAVALDGPVNGSVRLDGTIFSSGFRYLSRNEAPVLSLDKLDADDLLIGGPAVRIRGSVTGGILVDAPPLDRDTEDADEDDDGVPDIDETTGAITSLGSAPALLIGGAGAITIGNVGATAAESYGLLIKGSVTANGIYDGISSNAIQIGGLGGTVDMSGGIRITGTVSGVAFKADTTGLLLKSGVTAPSIVVEGSLSAGAEGGAGFTPNARALVIEQGAAVQSLNVTGTLRAGVTGPTGNATAILDAGGNLATITNAGVISATVASGDIEAPAIGNAIALDLRANTTGVNLSQVASTRENFTPSITGDILFSSGAQNDTFNLGAGNTAGTIDFGGGSDSFQIGAGASARADLRKSSGAFNLGVLGALNMTNSNQINASTLNVGSAGSLTFTADPGNADAAQRVTFLNVAGTATMEQGSKIALEFKSKLSDPTTYTLLRAGALVNNGIDTSLIGSLPLVFEGTVTTSGNEINVSVRRREAAELGLSGGRAAAYNAFYAAFDADPGVAAAVFSKTNAADFNKLYDQFLPDYSGGPFNSLATAARSVLQVQGEEPKDMVAGEPRSWLQEVGVGVKHESVNDIEYQSGGFGLAGGVEHPWGENSAVGFSAAFISSEIRNAQRAVGSSLTASALMSSIYWRSQKQGLVLDASLSGGYAWFGSDRRIVDADPTTGAQNLVRQPTADWKGGLAAARFGVTYNWENGPFYARPDAVLDAVYLREAGYNETGGGAGANLHIDSRSNYEAALEAGILVGARFGRTFRWGPELRVAYRGILNGGEGDTTGNFISVPGTSFALPGLSKDKGRVVVRAALRGSGAYANFALEASGDIGEVYQAYMARVLVRFLF